MKIIKVLGSGCAKCSKTVDLIKAVAQEQGALVSVEKETSPQVMMEYGVMSTPAVVIDGTLIHSGSVPQAADIKEWLA